MEDNEKLIEEIINEAEKAAEPVQSPSTTS